MSSTKCKYCGAMFPSKKVGPHEQKFCSSVHKTAFHTATRLLGEKVFISGVLGPMTIKQWLEAQTAEDASCTTVNNGADK